MRVGNLILLAAMLVAVVASFVYLGIDLGALVAGDSLAQMRQYASGFLHPDFSNAHLLAIARGHWKPWPCPPSAPCSPPSSA